jgi:hypothetical protein
MMKMREQGVVIQEKLIQSKEKYQNAKRKGASKDRLEQMKSIYKHQKKTSMMYTMEYEQLKKEIGYSSPQCDDSLSSNDSDNPNSE